jgi:hypothetical protein
VHGDCFVVMPSVVLDCLAGGWRSWALAAMISARFDRKLETAQLPSGQDAPDVFRRQTTKQDGSKMVNMMDPLKSSLVVEQNPSWRLLWTAARTRKRKSSNNRPQRHTHPRKRNVKTPRLLRKRKMETALRTKAPQVMREAVRDSNVTW